MPLGDPEIRVKKTKMTKAYVEYLALKGRIQELEDALEKGTLVFSWADYANWLEKVCLPALGGEKHR